MNHFFDPAERLIGVALRPWLRASRPGQSQSETICDARRFDDNRRARQVRAMVRDLSFPPQQFRAN